MIEIILPDRGPVANLDDDVISAIVQRIYHTSDYTISSEARRIGRYIKVKNTDDGGIHYVCLSNPGNDSRNARLMQFVSPAYIEYRKDHNDNKTFDILDTGEALIFGNPKLKKLKFYSVWRTCINPISKRNRPEPEKPRKRGWNPLPWP